MEVDPATDEPATDEPATDEPADDDETGYVSDRERKWVCKDRDETTEPTEPTEYTYLGCYRDDGARNLKDYKGDG